MGLLMCDLTLCLAHAYTYVQKVSKYLAKEHRFEIYLRFKQHGSLNQRIFAVHRRGFLLIDVV